jgi:hypothetical protein
MGKTARRAAAGPGRNASQARPRRQSEPPRWRTEDVSGCAKADFGSAEGAMGGIESQAGEVMIGKQWLTISDKRRRRLDNEDDFVRAEIGAALKQEVSVIPSSCRTLSHTRWKTNVGRLMKELDKVIEIGRTGDARLSGFTVQALWRDNLEKNLDASVSGRGVHQVPH